MATTIEVSSIPTLRYGPRYEYDVLKSTLPLAHGKPEGEQKYGGIRCDFYEQKAHLTESQPKKQGISSRPDLKSSSVPIDHPSKQTEIYSPREKPQRIYTYPNLANRTSPERGVGLRQERGKQCFPTVDISRVPMGSYSQTNEGRSKKGGIACRTANCNSNSSQVQFGGPTPPPWQ
eukprot:NODE_7608_length_759_cov_137.718553_g6995_i0.p1 GENE.NODE_7608_length_759_cov_137.718553_g6995_i0~~NODE_7608_length_759_cov_137.718553_g6995_i0.p1  ORF type:complete len:176 (-),score=32.96 NODE_7608_length_759_cov_137.718553_g6995_i0:183-710(-)